MYNGGMHLVRTSENRFPFLNDVDPDRPEEECPESGIKPKGGLAWWGLSLQSQNERRREGRYNRVAEPGERGEITPAPEPKDKDVVLSQRRGGCPSRGGGIASALEREDRQW